MASKEESGGTSDSAASGERAQVTATAEGALTAGCTADKRKLTVKLW